MFFLLNITLSFCWLVLFFCCLCYSWFSHLYLKNPFAFGDLLSKELELVSRFRQLVEASSPWKSFPSSIIQGGCKMSRGLTGLMLLGHDNLFPQKLRPLLTMVQSWPCPLRVQPATSSGLFSPLNGLPWWLSDKESTRQCRRHGFHPWVRKIPWRRKWHPTPVLLPGKVHGQRRLAGYSPWGRKRVGQD